MRRFNVHKNQGFTLLEILVALAITGVIAALTGPNLLAWLNSNKVQEATDSIQSALQDAQRQAIRRGRNCTLNFTNPTGTNPTVYSQITASEPGCLVATNTGEFLKSAAGSIYGDEFSPPRQQSGDSLFFSGSCTGDNF
ncbi:MAG UNVERIFIED_CONTAM: prepilin-type N-terminal cleavage/methylation domain-containing protein [Anaerolineae bacterium]|jgi:prepilin-type N-terminal cleavage/methylation domain-containing protein